MERQSNNFPAALRLFDLVSLAADLCGSWWGVVAARCKSSQASVFLLQVDELPLSLGQLQEAVHGPQVDQQRLGGLVRILLLPQDL